MYQQKLNDLRVKLLPHLKVANLWLKVLAVLETVPLTLFLLARTYNFDMPQRIFIGGAASIFVFCCFYASRKIKFTPLFFGTNLFFVTMSAILILPVPSLQIFFLDLREVGMFLSILIVGLAWHISSPFGLLSRAQLSPKSKRFSWMLLGIYTLTPAISHYFKGDENLAGALPFVIIVIAEIVLNYLLHREIQRSLDYAK